jgi:hypothetical protein
LLWVLHLTGGARATWGQNEKLCPVELSPSLLSGERFDFAASSLGEVLEKCNAMDLQVFGLSPFQHQIEFDGIVPPEWRTVHYAPRPAWLGNAAAVTWSQIAYAAWKGRAGHLWDCAARVSYQIETITVRLRQISDGYGNQLQTLIARRAFSDSHRLDDLWTKPVFLAVQSFLTDACVLRDYLAEFAAAFFYKVVPAKRITKMAELRGFMRREKPKDALTEKLWNACEAGGWLFELGKYRNLVVHAAPLALAQRRLWVWCQAHSLPDGSLLPTVRFPLPPNPAGIVKARDNPDYEDFEKMTKEFAGIAEVSPSLLDALQYAHGVVGDAAELAAELATFSPIQPQMPTLRRTDLGGPLRWA